MILTELEQVTNAATPFIVYWMQLMNIIRTLSINHYTKIKDKWHERQVSLYSGEDIVNMAQDYYDDCLLLDGAALYDHNLTLTMLKEMSKGGGPEVDSHNVP